MAVTFFKIIENIENTYVNWKNVDFGARRRVDQWTEGWPDGSRGWGKVQSDAEWIIYLYIWWRGHW